METEQKLNFRQLQSEVASWRKANFKPSKNGYHSLLGAVEEIGELAHAHLKEEQGIRGTPQEHQEKAMDAVGDIIVYLCDYCDQRGWDLQAVVEEVWGQVKKRNWKENPLTGGNNGLIKA